ncbi:DUF2316 family protein [Staphylococcus simiae]|uniref:DUF2316 family protein n=1 Tax=Staphylococcus simiae TaxID=308354 RepID=UPI001A965324|nr:DUF2316 family protein [Staphylococcus simiae]MBO1198195.1 DUF2316 family protein [Staphylococcus simiae]MBO1200261.1 DUF2316 family protein [Staphylococcus simiae]MBO1202575.1 DUF2316 family protein [Staphylococcus simiae]MBO1210147.1 DUF2316 family protein [Staphylococcus simiae]MBO1228719.1 DUF2316 family protein [Staphylococcus simiae]
MSLNKEQIRITKDELQAHFRDSTLTTEDIAQQLNISSAEVAQVLAMESPKGIFGNKLQRFIHLVWDVRDVINDNIKAQGQQPEEYTYLKGNKEDYWFLR